MAQEENQNPSQLDASAHIPPRQDTNDGRVDRLWTAAKVCVGVLLCLVTALLTAALVGPSAGAEYVPLGFAVVPIIVAAVFGRLAGLLGAVGGLIVLAYTLFPPLGSFHVENGTARQNLGWMVLFALVLCFLAFPPANHSHRS